MSGRKPSVSVGIAFAVAVVLFTRLSTASFITLTKDGYQDVVVTIEEGSIRTSDCFQAIEQIKTLISNTSTSFGNALEKHVYFGTVTIVVPDSWASESSCSSLLTSTNVSDIPWPRSHQADMRVTPDHPIFGWQPHSFQYGECMQPGLPVNVPSSFVIDSQGLLSRGMRLAREWAHYRYGVFDEGGQIDDNRHPAAYNVFQTTDGSAVPRINSCSDKQTPIGSWNREECKTSAVSDCEYVADVYNPGIYSSLMYRPDLDHMEKFCTKDNHDDSVPSKLTHYCGSLSASEVIYKHADFNPTVNPNNVSIAFNVIKNPFSGYHILLDSASFFNQSSFDVARAALIQFVVSLSEPLLVSIDFFENGGTTREVVSPLQMTEENRQNSTEAIAVLLNAETWKGYGSPYKFSEALTKAKTRAYDGQDILILSAVTADISDLDSIAESFRTEKITAHVIYMWPAITSSVPLAKLSHYGDLHFVPQMQPDNVNSPYAWATNVLQSVHSKNSRIHRAKIDEISISKESNSDFKKTGTFYVDSPPSRIIISLYYINVVNAINVETFKLFNPDGLELNIATNIEFPQFQAYVFDQTSKRAGKTLQAGQWRYEIELNRLSANAALRLDVLADAADSSMIQLRTWSSAIDNQALDFTKAPIGLYAQLTQNSKPISGASVVAQVYTNDGSGTSVLIESVSLLDNGIADVTSGDGIYSGWLTQFSNSSVSYSVRYYAYGFNSTATVDNQTYSRPPTTGSNIPLASPSAAAEHFKRYQIGSSFQVTSSLSSYDSIKPQRVTDLAVVSYDVTSKTAVLQWTPPRDNYGTGDFVTHFKMEWIIGTETPTTQDFTVPASNETSFLTVDVPDVAEGQHVRYRIQSRDDAFNWAEMSNVASLAGPAVPTGGLSEAGKWALIGVGIAILVIILIIILICCCCPVKARRQKNKAARKMRRMFKKDKNKDERDGSMTREVTRYQPPNNNYSWQSPSIDRVDTKTTIERRNSKDSFDSDRNQVELRQKAANPSANNNAARTSERYFDHDDIQHMAAANRQSDGYDVIGHIPVNHHKDQETYSERGTDEMIKRAPSMDLQLAAILKLNSSNLSINQAGLGNDGVSAYSQPDVVIPKIYAKKPNPGSRPASMPVYYQPNQPLSQSESDLYYAYQTDPVLQPTVGIARSNHSNSYHSVYAERADVVPKQQSPRSSLAAALRSGMASDDFRDSNYAIYTDPRFDAPTKNSSFAPAPLHAANKVGLPPAPPSVPPPLLPRTHVDDARASQASWGSDQMPPSQMSRSSSKPSLISAV